MKKGRHNYHYIKTFNPTLPFENTDLLQIGTAYLQPNTRVNPHTHIDFFELTVITSGRGTVSTNNVPISVKDGDVYVSFPFDLHILDSDPDEQMNYNFLAFFIKDSALMKDMERIAMSHRDPSDRIIRNDVLCALVASAISEIKNEQAYGKRYLDSLFEQIVIQMIRSFDKQPQAPYAPEKKEELCYQVMDYIKANIYSINSLSDLSKVFGYDYSYISRIFTQTISQTVSQYYRMIRLETAKILIRQNKLKLTEISEKLNYSSIYAFSKSFKQQFSVSPREYKKSLYPSEIS